MKFKFFLFLSLLLSDCSAVITPIAGTCGLGGWLAHFYYEYKKSKRDIEKKKIKKNKDQEKNRPVATIPPKQIIKNISYQRLAASGVLIGTSVGAIHFLQKSTSKDKNSIVPPEKKSFLPDKKNDVNQKNKEKIDAEQKTDTLKIEETKEQKHLNSEESKQKPTQEEKKEHIIFQKIEKKTQTTEKKVEKIQDKEELSREENDSKQQVKKEYTLDEPFKKFYDLFQKSEYTFAGYYIYRNQRYDNSKKNYGNINDLSDTIFTTQKRSHNQGDINILQHASQVYKIHLMPESLTTFLPKLASFFDTHQEILPAINAFKFRVKIGENTNCRYLINYWNEIKEAGIDTPDNPSPINKRLLQDKIIPEDQLPQIVIYAYGKEDAQNILNFLFKHFKDEPGAKDENGKCYPPRYNGKVTDLIWIAQGNGDDKKKGSNSEFFEPNKIYFSQKVADFINVKHESFFLRHPETDEILNNPGT